MKINETSLIFKYKTAKVCVYIDHKNRENYASISIMVEGRWEFMGSDIFKKDLFDNEAIAESLAEEYLTDQVLSQWVFTP